MEYDDFKKKIEEQRAKSFAEFQKMFNAEMAKRGSKTTLDDVIGNGPVDKTAHDALSQALVMPPWEGEKLEQLCDLYMEIYQETTDEDPRDVVLRAMATYRHFVRHARAGGEVRFVGINGAKDRKLTVKLR